MTCVQGWMTAKRGPGLKCFSFFYKISGFL